MAHVQQRQLILQQDNALPHVARVCRDFPAKTSSHWTGQPYIPDLSPQKAFVGRSGQKSKEASESPITLVQLRNAFVDEWNNISVRTVNALVNSIQRRKRAAAAARGVGGIRDIDRCS